MMRPSYVRLGEFLDSESSSVNEVVLSSISIENLLGAPLPPRAQTDLSWWRQGPQAPKLALEKVGWRVLGMSPGIRGIRFIRSSRRH